MSADKPNKITRLLDWFRSDKYSRPRGYSDDFAPAHVVTRGPVDPGVASFAERQIQAWDDEEEAARQQPPSAAPPPQGGGWRVRDPKDKGHVS